VRKNERKKEKQTFEEKFSELDSRQLYSSRRLQVNVFESRGQIIVALGKVI
jgi:N-dimethylarginine dimethylaminohydrolase